MHSLFNQYSKELVRDILDIGLIKKAMKNQEMYDLMVKHGYITKRTHAVVGSFYSNDWSIQLAVRRTSGKEIFHIYIQRRDIPQILENLKQGEI